MGFFDKLKNIGKAIKSNIPGDIKDGINHISKDFNKDISSNIDSSSAENTIPDKFNKFPSFDGEISHVSEKETPSYILCALTYENVSSLDFEDYLYEITRAGYIQQSNDRYEKENTFIIVEYIEKTLHIVFHINK
ncbi:TPA: hypothetical protein CPT79_05365 [Candidatus Gastranaerophilales bacterium HUM_6]|jgi:hypothetical protein|nr:MAG TPA: hypothetical protein CPT79_05365 [Candidatus Gastranaerophilales bacterium HUM_6]HJJ10657.1 hypothetical protein [Clostridiaceae bacterium]